MVTEPGPPSGPPPCAPPTAAAAPLPNLDFNAELSKDAEFVKLDEHRRLLFAKQVLIGLAILCVAAIAAYAYSPANSALKEVFELIKIGALPIVILVVSFYFPNNLRR